MRFFIGNGLWVEKKANLMAVMQDVKDETLDTANVEILADDEEMPYEPRTYCKIELNGETKYYRLATDNVSVFSLFPKKTYKHSLSLVQTTRELSHHILPNMVITKPREKERTAYFACSCHLNWKDYLRDETTSWKGFVCTSDADGGDGYESYRWEEPIAFTENSPIGMAQVEIRVKAVKVNKTSQSVSCIDVKSLPTMPSWCKPKAVVYVKKNNVETSIATFAIDGKSWDGEALVLPLSQSQVDAINALGEGELCIEIESYIVSASVPEALKNKPWTYDALFYTSEYDGTDYQQLFMDARIVATRKTEYLYDTLKKIIAREQSKYSLGNQKPLFRLPTSGDDYDVLTKTESPEFSFSGQTVFEAVSQVLSTIDALPRFEWETNIHGVYDTLHLDYLNKRGKEIASMKFTGQSSGLGEEKYVNGILTNFQKAEVLRKFPSGVEGTYANVRLKGYGVPELTDFAMVLDKPIKYIKKLEVEANVTTWAIVKGSDGAYTQLKGDKAQLTLPLDISPFIFEESVYSSALSDRGDYPTSTGGAQNHNIRLQMNCLKFTNGSKNIDLGNKATNEYNKVYLTFWNALKDAMYRFNGTHSGYYFTPSAQGYGELSFVSPIVGDYSSVFFRCEYASDVDGRLIVQSPMDKEDGEMNASASGASIDLGKLGLNMLGLSMRTGVPTLTYSQCISSWDDCVKVGDTIEKDYSLWVANKCQYQVVSQTKDGNKTDLIKGTIEFTRDFNGLAKRIAIDQNKRYSNISSSIVDKCEVNIINYVYLHPSFSKEAVFRETTGATPIDLPQLARFIGKPFGVTFGGALIDGKLYEPLDVDFARYYLEPQTSGVRDIYMPVTVYGAGNCVCFEASFDNAISAGIQMETTTEDNGKWWYGLQQATQTKQYFGKDVKYADDEGYAETISIDYVSGVNAKFPTTFPYIPNSGTNKLGTLYQLKFNKMPNEIIAVNYEMAFLSKLKGIGGLTFMGRKFFELVSEPMRQTGCKLFVSDETYSLLDEKAKGTGYDIGMVQCMQASDYSSSTPYRDYYLNVTGVDIPQGDYHSYCLADEDGNILVACNFDFKANEDRPLPIIHFTTATERLE